jgi:Na+/phosphate symporter
MSAFMIFLLLGGLGMFLYGMKLMSDGLENSRRQDAADPGVLKPSGLQP